MKWPAAGGRGWRAARGGAGASGGVRGGRRLVARALPRSRYTRRTAPAGGACAPLP